MKTLQRIILLIVLGAISVPSNAISPLGIFFCFRVSTLAAVYYALTKNKKSTRTVVPQQQKK